MSHSDHCEAIKITKDCQDTGKTYQELYDQYIRQGDAAIISEDIVLAEKYYQYADHFLRLMNDPSPIEQDLKTFYLPSSSSEEKIARALKGIIIERAVRQLAFRQRTLRVVKTVKAVKQQIRAKNKKPVTSRVQQIVRAKMLDIKAGGIDHKLSQKNKPSSHELYQS